MFKGIGASPGVAFGRAVVLADEKQAASGTAKSGIEEETARLESALSETRRQITDIMDRCATGVGEKEARIFKMQLLVLDDAMFLNRVKDDIRSGRLSAAAAVQDAVSSLSGRFEGLSDDYLRQRAIDIVDVGKRLLQNLNRLPSHDTGPQEAGIIFAPDLTPSETSLMDPQTVLGLVTEAGGPTSHTAILARALNIPAVVGTKGVLALVRDGDTVIVDGGSGEVFIRPDVPTVDCYRRRAEAERSAREKLAGAVDLPAVTLDGFRVAIAVNIGGPREIGAIPSPGAEGVGLFRTEFLFLSRDTLPSEDEQFGIYREVVSRAAPHPVVFRTLDAGADKSIPALRLAAEQNPFLGLRGIRLCLRQEQGMFRDQLRALVRASVFGKMAVMLPMVSDVAEIEASRKILGEVLREPGPDGEKIAEDVPLGIMVETPAAAVMADSWAAAVDFFSIGTNDLIQYVMAADRLNERVAYLFQPFHPAVLRMISGVVQAAHRYGKRVTVCGEMAADPLAVLLLTGMDVDGLSMSPGAIPLIKNTIRGVKKNDVTALARKALGLPGAGQVVEMVREFYRERLDADV